MPTCAPEVCVPAGSWAGNPMAPGSVCGSEGHAGAPAVLKWRDKPYPLLLTAPQLLWVWSHTDTVLQVLWDASKIMLFKALIFCDFIAEGQWFFFIISCLLFTYLHPSKAPSPSNPPTGYLPLLELFSQQKFVVWSLFLIWMRCCTQPTVKLSMLSSPTSWHALSEKHNFVNQATTIFLH